MIFLSDYADKTAIPRHLPPPEIATGDEQVNPEAGSSEYHFSQA
jgi:hypothetical protein